MAQITQPGSGMQYQWDYKPLSYSGDLSRLDFPVYSIPDRLTDDSYVDEDAAFGDHFYFSSSMMVVDEMRQSTALKIDYCIYLFCIFWK